MRYSCYSRATGYTLVYDMLANYEFCRLYIYRNPSLYRQFALELVNQWNNSINNRDNNYLYRLLD